jgi:hypothetical protein
MEQMDIDHHPLPEGEGVEIRAVPAQRFESL